ncbi:heavy metal translocating P-type ATPase metal-binding domain-containing protein [Lutimonas saemankumensis]|uniref:heavy metal translocating P-type ATPase n=1 Tax=Lutimonas saemankumensis TaxID=483016 RepID=UPI001CD22209|nr:heavy metal translocating P-type ATPase metal-binding domain-containing protein [Lutimonas saemankumensis]MCA0932062.1 heavy metal translocating P-type ATPase metal-binding domain-containing protein [Lutimonas saemankumensis]
MSKENCYHCGLDCNAERTEFDEKSFCCNGCRTVYEILNQNQLTGYYDLESNPGTAPTDFRGKFDYLDNEDIAEQLIEFDDQETSVANFYIPTIHCSSCIWVLENLHKLNDGIKIALVNFPKKEVRITFRKGEISLKEVVELIASIGYEPYISLDSTNVKSSKTDRKLIYQVAIAGFAFGNVMMLSFPEYFQMDEYWLNRYKPFFRGLMFLLSLPALLYSGQDYFSSAFKGLKHGILNIDVPISLGILVLFFRSSYEIISQTGQGYFDSLTGLIFFLLLGKIFQQKTYGFLSFERDYKSYFPIAVTRIAGNNEEQNISIHEIQQGDRLLIRNDEIIPVDGILISKEGMIDYSFVTGESIPVSKRSGDKLYAGGKQTRGAIEMEAIETVKQSYLTQLWSHDVFHKENPKNIKSLTDSISKQFTIIILSIALISGIYWYFEDKSAAFQVVSAILIIACPCALALSAPFSLGNMIRLFGKHKFYLKNTAVIESMAKVNAVVFDKTGTITSNRKSEIIYEGQVLDNSELSMIKTLLRSSNHPLSRILYDHIDSSDLGDLSEFEEFTSKGIEGRIDNKRILLGSASFVGMKDEKGLDTAVYVSFENKVKGKFIFKNAYRKGLREMIKELDLKYKISLLSGDNEGEKARLEDLLPEIEKLLFNQKPEDKLEFIKSMQENKEHVMMLGDGLNDAGALAQSNVGVAISENINVFSPACDGILDASRFEQLPDFLRLSNSTIVVIKVSFAISFLYNIIGLLFAVTGNLSPIVAAILMPISSISVVLFATVSTNYLAKKILS